MEYVLKLLVQHYAWSPAHYWHLRLLCAILLGPLLGILYLLFFGRRPAGRVGTGSTMWVDSEGRLWYSSGHQAPRLHHPR